MQLFQVTNSATASLLCVFVAMPYWIHGAYIVVTPVSDPIDAHAFFENIQPTFEEDPHEHIKNFYDGIFKQADVLHIGGHCPGYSCSSCMAGRVKYLFPMDSETWSQFEKKLVQINAYIEQKIGWKRPSDFFKGTVVALALAMVLIGPLFLIHAFELWGKNAEMAYVTGNVFIGMPSALLAGAYIVSRHPFNIGLRRDSELKELDKIYQCMYRVFSKKDELCKSDAEGYDFAQQKA